MVFRVPLLDNANQVPVSHIPALPASLIVDFGEATQDVVGAMLQAGSGVSLIYNDSSNILTITSTVVADPTDREVVRDTIAAALQGTGNVQVTSDDTADTITITTSATVNQTDAYLLARSHHTGTQTASTISDFTEASEDAVAALLARSTHSGITFTYSDAGNTLSASVTGGVSTDAEAVRDVIGAALVAGSLISINYNDAADTITISTTATANSTDAQLRDRSTHTGTQAISTITNLQTTLNGKARADSISKIAAAGASQTIANTTTFADFTLTGSTCAITLPTSYPDASLTILLRQDSTGGRLVTWPGSVTWVGGAPTLASASGAQTVVTLLTTDSGTTWTGMWAA